MEIARLLLLFLIALSLCYTFLATYFTRSFFKKKRQEEGKPGPQWPPVSIIKPVAGVEKSTLENFMSFCDQEYPHYEIVFSLSGKQNPAISLIEEVKKKFPNREIRWTIGTPTRGPNYKVGNLIEAVRNAKYDILAISDSDMQVGRDYLREIIAIFLRGKAGLVTCLYRGTHLDNFLTGLQALSIQTDFIPKVLLDHQLEGISYSFGATICTSKKILESSAPLEPLQGYLADDYQIGNRVHKKGYGISLSPYLVDHVFDAKDPRELFLRQLRWAVTQRVCRPIGYIASIITHAVSLSFLFLVLERLSPVAMGLFLFVIGVRLLSSSYLNKTVIHNDEVTRYLWLIPLNDLLGTVVWFFSLFVSTVHWREHRFRVLRGGRIVELQ